MGNIYADGDNSIFKINRKILDISYPSDIFKINETKNRNLWTLIGHETLIASRTMKKSFFYWKYF